MTSLIPGPIGIALDLLATLFVLCLGVAFAVLVAIFILDVTQRRDAIRRNYPVVGRFRNLFITLGEFFRQYFFAMDREELPFNRAERQWGYGDARNMETTSAFGRRTFIRPTTGGNCV